jgi:FG-GAP-like repeat/FG-GAP repeat
MGATVGMMSEVRVIRVLQTFGRVFPLCVATPILFACGGGGEGSGGSPAPTNSAPRISVPASINVLEGSRLSANLDITDPDGDPLRVSVTGADAGFFILTKPVGSSSYVLQMFKPLDFENPEDADHDNAYEFDAVANDGRSTATGHVVVRVDNVAGNSFSEEQGMAAVLGINENEFSGNSAGFAGDLDGDGMSEVLVGDSRRASPQPVGGVIARPGSVFVISGASVARSSSGKVQLLGQSTGRSVELTWPATVANTVPEFGHRALGLADFDGDHLGEIAVSSYSWDGVGVVDIIRGSLVASALQNAATAPQVDAGSTPALRIRGDSINDAFGFDVARVPDLDGDGREELLVCAPGSMTSNVYLIFGSTLQVALAAGGDFVVGSAIASGGVVRFAGTNRFERRCMAVASAGDFDGDGKPDVVIGESQGGSVGLAQAHVIYGRAILQARQATGLISLENLEQAGKGVTLVGEFTLDAFASAVGGIGDFNNDGLDDVAIGAPRSPADSSSSQSVTDKGAVFVLFGSRTPFHAHLSVSDLNTGLLGFIIRGTQELEATGKHLAAAGDVNGDGFADFYVSSPGATIDPRSGGPIYTFVGRIDVVFGTNAILNGAVQLDGYAGRTKIIPFPATQYMADMRAYGDVDGDGRNDLLVSATGSAKCVGNSVISTGGAFYVSGSRIAAATNGTLDLGDHLFGAPLPTQYQGATQLSCASP